MKAMLLAAGRGERMRPLTDTCPKPLLEIGGKALIVWHIERLVAAGVRDIVINHAHLGHMLEAALSDGARFDAHIRYSPETEALETAGGIRYALPLLGESPFLVINADIFCDYDFGKAMHIASRLNAIDDLAHLVLVDNPPQHPDGDFAMDGDRVEESKENCLTFSGIGIYRPALFADIRPGEKARLGTALREAMHNHKVSGEHYRGIWHDIGTPERLATLNKHYE